MEDRKYTLVGAFADTEAARHACEELIRVRDAIAENNPAPLTDYFVYEIEAKADGFQNLTISHELARLVAVRPKTAACPGPAPLDKLIEQLGGEVFVDGTDKEGRQLGTVNADIRCEAPSAEVADSIKRFREGEFCRIDRFRRRLSLYVYHYNLTNLPGLVDYLRERRCKDIVFRLQGTRYHQSDDINLP